jgi:hypothetical protein
LSAGWQLSRSTDPQPADRRARRGGPCGRPSL